MPRISAGTIFKAAIIAGVAAGLLVALFHFVITEPVIEQAVNLEEQRKAAEGMEEMEVVSRPVQQAGLFLGFFVYGLIWALLFGVVYTLAQRILPGATPGRRGLALALVGYWCLGLAPFLKYPANPPGVGDAESITLRQTLYLTFLVISVLSGILAVAAYHYLDRQRSPMWQRVAIPMAILVVVVGLAGVLLPPNPDAVEIPMNLLDEFRVRSLVGLTLFWALLGSGFALLIRRSTASGQYQRRALA